MGYLNNSTITVDAILTKKGRELLARGRDEFKITQFALADDEVDYDLYNPEHPLGNAYYGAAIENMPIVEALADETQMLKYKLVTLPKGTARIPVVSVGQTTIELQSNESVTITPQTVNFQGGNRRFGYTAILSDSDVAEIVAVRGVRDQAASVPQFIGDSEAAQSITVSGVQFEITAKELLTADRSITILFIGNETGGRASVTLTVKKVEIATTGLTAG
jgi:hypothetical protein